MYYFEPFENSFVGFGCLQKGVSNELVSTDPRLSTKLPDKSSYDAIFEKRSFSTLLNVSFTFITQSILSHRSF